MRSHAPARPVRGPCPASLVCVAAIVVAAAAGEARGQTPTGAVTQAPLPFPANVLQIQGNLQIYFFVERSGVTLQNAMPVNITTSDSYQDATKLTPGNVAANTVVNSYFFQFNPPTTPGADNVWTAVGSIRFNETVLGIQVNDVTLDAGDPVLGRPGLAYPTKVIGRGLDLVPGTALADVIVFGADRKSISFDLKTNSRFINGYDQVRVITAVPEPSVPALAGACAVLAAAWAAARAVRRRPR